MNRHQLIAQADALAAFYAAEYRFLGTAFFLRLKAEIKQASDATLQEADVTIQKTIENGINNLGPCGLAC